MATFKGSIELPRDPSIRRDIERIFDIRFKKIKAKMMTDFWRHNVTRELDNRSGGANQHSNYSGTLSDYASSKAGTPNLYTFLGFSDPFDPIADSTKGVAPMLESFDWTSLDWTRNGINFRVRYYTYDDIVEATAGILDWYSGSWVYGVEHGMPGFEFYLAFAAKQPSSRARYGLQTNSANRPPHPDGSFNPVSYIEKIIESFKQSIAAITY